MPHVAPPEQTWASLLPSPPQFFDNGGAVYGEVQLYVLNQSGRTIGAGQSAVFKVAISTLQRF